MRNHPLSIEAISPTYTPRAIYWKIFSVTILCQSRLFLRPPGKSVEVQLILGNHPLSIEAISPTGEIIFMDIRHIHCNHPLSIEAISPTIQIGLEDRYRNLVTILCQSRLFLRRSEGVTIVE
mgnify:CR=1 FL=1